MGRKILEIAIFVVVGLVVVGIAIFVVVKWFSPGFQGLTALPYTDPAEVWISRPYEPEHQGIDISTDKVIDLIAPADGVFMKEMYYHAGVPRWQVNAEIRNGKYGIELLLEPGDSVSEAEAQVQYDMLIADGTEVKAGDLLGQRYIAPGQPYSILHWAVRINATGVFECPIAYFSDEVKADVLMLFHRDHPIDKLCTGE